MRSVGVAWRKYLLKSVLRCGIPARTRAHRMARIPYADPNANDEVKALAERIQKERGRLHNLYLMLLNSPPVARGWLDLLTAVRQQCNLPARYREFAILRIAILNGADYEYVSHVPIALKEGITEAQIDALED